jgi:hypothetical protein
MLINPFYAPDNLPHSQTLLLSFVYDNYPESLSSSVSCFSFSDEDYRILGCNTYGRWDEDVTASSSEQERDMEEAFPTTLLVPVSCSAQHDIPKDKYT